MKILALVTDAFGGNGGIAQYNRDLFQAMDQSNLVSEVVVLPRLGDGKISVLPDKVSQLTPTFGRTSYTLKAVVTARRHGPFDLIFCGHIYQAPLASLLGYLFRTPVWLQTHGVDAWDKPSPLVQAAFESADLITSVSRFTRRRILEWANIDPARIKVLPNTMRFPIRTRDLDARVRDELPFAGKPYLLTVSRINKEDAYKGHRRVIGVLGRLRQRHPDLQYVIAGDGDDRGELEALVAKLGLAQNIHFLGHVSTELLQELLAAARTFTMPSTKEGFGIVFLEAAAHGLPVVAGNRDGSIDALCEGAIGVLVNPDDPDALFEALSTAVAGSVPPPDPLALQRFAADNYRRHVDALIATLKPAPRFKTCHSERSIVPEDM